MGMEILKASKKERLQVPIALFLGSVFLIFFLILIAIASQELGNIFSVKKIAQEIRRESLPEFADNQKTLANIESLRRLAEVAYATDDVRTRRNARLSAVALTTESIFESDAGFRDAARKISASITALSREKDKLSGLARRYTQLKETLRGSLGFFIEHAPDTETRQELLQFYAFDISSILSSVGQQSSTSAQLTSLKRRAVELRVILTQATESIVKKDPALKADALEHSQAINQVLDELDLIRVDMNRQYVHNKQLWEGIDYALREMRDQITSGSEQAISQALQTISQAAIKTQHSAMIMFGVLVGFFVILYFLSYLFIIKPLRWTSHKLTEIQDGNLDSTSPAIHIKEISQIAILLERFSHHLAELYTQANQLAEDVAAKRDLEEVMRAVFRVSLDGYIVWNLDGVENISSGVMTLLGVDDVAELKEKWLHFALPTEERRKLVFSETREHGVMRNEITLLTASGDKLPCEVTHIAILFHGQACILTYIRDLRLQKRTEEALRQAKEDAEVATQAKSDFLARMSHELRTPMNGVLGLTYLALQSAPPPQQKTFLSKIQSSAKLLLGIINDILDFSKIEEKKLDLERIPFQVAGIIPTIEDLLEPQAAEKNIRFSAVYRPLSPYSENILGDPLRLTQVLLNLCGNAVKFTEQGFVSLDIATLSEDRGHVTLLFSVTDSGIGLDDDEIQRIFRPFSQADSSTTRKHGGTGLGLMISKLLVELMGGAITVDSTPGNGSIFSFMLTFDKEEARTGRTQEAAPVDEELSCKGKHILVVEDNNINQDIIQALLESFDCQVSLANNGQEALDILQHEFFDCILMDIQMPVMDGLTSARLIRETGRAAVKNLPIIAMTAHAMQEDIQKSLDAGMNDHLTKPIDINSLKNSLRKFLC